MTTFEQKETFYQKLEKYIETLDVKKRNKYTIKNAMYVDILNVLKGKKASVSPKFKFWVKQTFRCVQIGSTDIIYVLKNNLPLITHEEIFYKIADCHTAVGHSGRDKTWAEVDLNTLKKNSNLISFRLKLTMHGFPNRL